jgi:hypothetical protein
VGSRPIGYGIHVSLLSDAGYVGGAEQHPHTRERRRCDKDERSGHGFAAMLTWQLFTH